MSDVNDRLAEVQQGDNFQYVIFGDSAYKSESHIRSYYANTEQSERREWNYAFKSVRIAIEWNYAVTGTLFKYLSNKRKLKLLANPQQVSRVYTVATILRNCYAGLYGTQVSRYFGVTLPDDFLEHYLTQKDFF